MTIFISILMYRKHLMFMGLHFWKILWKL